MDVLVLDRSIGLTDSYIADIFLIGSKGQEESGKSKERGV